MKNTKLVTSNYSTNASTPFVLMALCNVNLDILDAYNFQSNRKIEGDILGARISLGQGF